MAGFHYTASNAMFHKLERWAALRDVRRACDKSADALSRAINELVKHKQALEEATARVEEFTSKSEEDQRKRDKLLASYIAAYGKEDRETPKKKRASDLELAKIHSTGGLDDAEHDAMDDLHKEEHKQQDGTRSGAGHSQGCRDRSQSLVPDDRGAAGEHVVGISG